VRVLLVCDNARATAQVRTALLGDPEVDILEVRTPQRGIQQLDDVGGFDIVIADADTTPTGGLVVSREVKAREYLGRDMPPVLVLIAREQDRYLAGWSLADASVLKPLDPFDLAEVVRSLVERKPVPELPGVRPSSGALPGDALGIEEGRVRAAAPLSGGP
jgi:DNA-binding response OmpR family regulator